MKYLYFHESSYISFSKQSFEEKKNLNPAIQKHKHKFAFFLMMIR